MKFATLCLKLYAYWNEELEVKKAKGIKKTYVIDKFMRFNEYVDISNCFYQY